MANIEHLVKLKEGVEAWNRWRSKEPGRPDLSGAHLCHAKLSGVDLGGADLRHTNLGGADLSFANLRNANLSRANLSRANLIMANLKGAVVDDANLTGANTFGVVRRFVGWLFGKRRRSGGKSSRGSARSRGHRVA